MGLFESGLDILYLLMTIDGEIAESEIQEIMRFLVRAGFEMSENRLDMQTPEIDRLVLEMQMLSGMEDEKLLQRFETASTYFSEKTNEHQKKKIVDFALKVIAADGKITANEEKYFNILGAHLGIDTTKFIEDTLKRMKETPVSAPSASFDRLPVEKQKMIINGCLKEFADFGYQNASTNRIVKNIGISKGSLFQYFENKEALYAYLLDISFNKIVNRIEKELNNLPSDLVEMLKKMTDIELNIYFENKLLFRFFMKTIQENSLKYKQDFLIQYLSAMDSIQNKIIDCMDKDQLSIEPDKAYKIIRWISTGLLQELFLTIDESQTLEEIRPAVFTQIDMITDALKYGIYK